MSKVGMICLLLSAALARAADPPVIPTGLDAYRLWARWPYQRIGARAYMRSTYDRRGGNEGADASHFLYQLADDFNVALDVQGPGILYFARYNHWHGSPWHYEVDGKDTLVRESSTADPLHPAEDSVFLPEKLFPNPLAWTWSQTRGADLSWVPIGFTSSFRMAYSRTFYGTGYYIYHQFTPGARLSQPITAWDSGSEPAADVLDLIRRAGSDIAPAQGAEGTVAQSGKLDLPAGGLATVWHDPRGPRMLRALEFSVPREQAQAFGESRLEITWDGRRQPSVDTPLSLFFGAGILYNRDGREYLVKSFPMVIRYTTDRVYLSCYFPMPYFPVGADRTAGRTATGHGSGVEGARATLPRLTEPGGLLSRHLSRSSAARMGQRSRAPRHRGSGGWRRLVRFVCRHQLHFFPRRGAQYARGRSALLFR